MELLLEGYDHIVNVVDEEGVPITEVVSQRNNATMTSLLASIPTFEVRELPKSYGFRAYVVGPVNDRTVGISFLCFWQ